MSLNASCAQRSSNFRWPTDRTTIHDSIEMKKASSVTRSKTLDRKSGMVVHGEPVQAEHAEDGAERAEENSDLEGDRK